MRCNMNIYVFLPHLLLLSLCGSSSVGLLCLCVDRLPFTFTIAIGDPFT